MAPDPKCAAIDSAMKRQGLNYGQLAAKVGSTEPRITDICTGADKPTNAEFDALAAALGITDPAHGLGHATK